MESKLGIKVCVLVTEGNKLLLIREWSNKRNGYFWNVIKGTYDNSEESLFDCAKREAKEEAGLDIELTHFVNCIVGYGKRTQLYFGFMAKALSGNLSLTPKEKQQQRGEDIVRIDSFSKDEIRKIRKDEFILEIVYELVKQWIEGRVYSLDLIIQKSFKKLSKQSKTKSN